MTDCSEVATPFNSTLGSDSSSFRLFLHSEMPVSKVIIEKSRGEGSLMEQDTIENVS